MSNARPALNRAVALGGLGVAAVLSARALLRPQSSVTDRRLLDWESVREHAYARTRESGALLTSPQLDHDCNADAQELAPLLAEVCTDAPVILPAFVAVDRRGFIDRNLTIIQRVSEPLEKTREALGQSRITALSRSATSRYVGEMLGFMSRRVLGQYDPVLSLSEERTGTPALFVVQTNIDEYRRKHNVDEHSLRRWLILHELTHAWQFGSHPWLRDYMETTLNELLMTDVLNAENISQHKIVNANVAKYMPAAVRAQIRGVAKVQAVMSLLEGYANYVMNQVGAHHLPDFAQLETSFHKRKTERSTLEKLILAITGINMKLKQYEIGERFCTAVVGQSSLEQLNRVWSGPELLPTAAELKTPSLWLARTS
jgi:coenzyme F420 biosynthesis associated uncharacterized protein